VSPAIDPATIRNRLLRTLPPAALAGLLPKLRPVELPLRRVLYEPDGPIEAAYFPEQGIISVVAQLDEGQQAEAGMAGRDGMVGTPLLAGVETSFTECMAQVAGSALRIEARAFRQELEASPPFRALMLRYNEAHQAQVMQTAACNANHRLEQRLARWLLMVHDRVEGDDLPLSQEFIATMLCVQRPSVSATAGILQRAGLIRHGGGRVAVLDRAGLEGAACECHAMVRRRYQALIGIPVG
jgi:CRP-like cAMP-binding protein